MRWYDLEPDVCMAISMIECSDLPKQLEYANYIIKLVQEKDVDLEYIKNSTKENMKNINYQRWYDKNETISTAFSYLKNTKKDIQKEVSLEVLSYMNIDASLKS